ncbi:MAG: hypothetical protein WCR54_02745 [Clostridia bacterium]
MNKLFSDKMMVKFKKVPSWAWVILLAITLFFANAYATIEGSKTITDMAIASVPKEVNVNYNGLLWMFGVFETFIYVLLFEVLAKWVSQSLIRRFLLTIGIKEMVMQIRIVLIICNFFIGLVGITSFFSLDVGNLLYAIFQFAILSFMYGWYYESFRKKYVPGRFQSILFAYIAKLFIGIYLIFSAYDFFYYMVLTESNLSVMEAVTLTVDVVIKLAIAVVAFMYDKKHLKKSVINPTNINNQNQNNNNNNNNFKINVDPFNFDKINNTNEEKKEDDKVFKDFDL